MKTLSVVTKTVIRNKKLKHIPVCIFPKMEDATDFVAKCTEYKKEFPIPLNANLSKIERQIKTAHWHIGHPLRSLNPTVELDPTDIYSIAEVPTPGSGDSTYSDPETEFVRIRRELDEAGLQLRATESRDSSLASMVLTSDMRHVATIYWDSRQARVTFRDNGDGKSAERYPVLSELNDRLRQSLRKSN